MMPSRRACDFAYGCYLLWGLNGLVTGLIRVSYTDAEWAGGAGGILLLLLPLIITAFVALLAAFVMTARLWNRWPLTLAAGIGILQFAVACLATFPSSRIESAVTIAFGAAVATIAAGWFLFLRSRQFPLVDPAI